MTEHLFRRCDKSALDLPEDMPEKGSPVFSSTRCKGQLHFESMSHHYRPPPGRRRRDTCFTSKHQPNRRNLNDPSDRTARFSIPRVSSPSFSMFAILIILCLFTTPSLAADLPSARADLLRSTLARLERRGEILSDRSLPPPLPIQQYDILRRQDDSSSAAAAASAASSASANGGSSVQQASTTTEGSSAPPTPSSSSATSGSATTQSSGGTQETALPRPFDSPLGTNFSSQACPNFFATFLSDATFNKCLPFSLLLQNSQSFFQAEKSIVRVTQALDATCHVDLQSCTNKMGAIAKDLIKNDNCGKEYKTQNPLVTQAYAGLVAYQPLYHAGCLQSETGSYCFADAISSTADTYVYFLGLGLSLPGGTRPNCTKCLQDTMSIFGTAASNSTQPVSQKYVAAAQQIDMGCGPTFVNASIPVGSGGSRASIGDSNLWGTSFILLFATIIIFVQ